MKEIEKFLEVVAKEEFIDGHEVLEGKWREWKNDPKTRQESFILKGLINGATALALRKMKRVIPSNKIWATFEKYRPLIYKITSKHQKMYIEAEKLLDTKYKKIMH